MTVMTEEVKDSIRGKIAQIIELPAISIVGYWIYQNIEIISLHAQNGVIRELPVLLKWFLYGLLICCLWRALKCAKSTIVLILGEGFNFFTQIMRLREGKDYKTREEKLYEQKRADSQKQRENWERENPQKAVLDQYYMDGIITPDVPYAFGYEEGYSAGVGRGYEETYGAAYERGFNAGRAEAARRREKEKRKEEEKKKRKAREQKEEEERMRLAWEDEKRWNGWQ